MVNVVHTLFNAERENLVYVWIKMMLKIQYLKHSLTTSLFSYNIAQCLNGILRYHFDITSSGIFFLSLYIYDFMLDSVRKTCYNWNFLTEVYFHSQHLFVVRVLQNQFTFIHFWSFSSSCFFSSLLVFYENIKFCISSFIISIWEKDFDMLAA